MDQREIHQRSAAFSKLKKSLRHGDTEITENTIEASAGPPGHQRQN